MSVAPPERNIVVVGGGFAGSTAAREIQRRMPRGHRVLLVSEESYTTFNPLLPEAVGASIFPEHVVAPLREVIDTTMGSRFVMGRVTNVDFDAKSLDCTTLAGPVTLPFAHLVLAFGNRARTDLLPGMEAFALPLKTVGDALEIRNAVLRRLACMELQADAGQRRVLGQFVVIGGGFSGVEVAGELVDYIRSARRYYPRVAMDEVGVTVLQDIDRLLPELPAALGVAAQRSLESRGVSIRLGRRAVEIFADGVRLDDGTLLQASTVVCTIGTRPNALTAAIALPVERGRIVVAPDLSVPGRRGVWALGDCAWVVNTRDGSVSPPTAQFAVRQAEQLAANVVAAIAGKRTAPFAYRARGAMAGIGHMNGVAVVFGVHLRGLPAWLLWRAYYLSRMPTFGRRVRIFVEWTWGMFFPVDITHLRFTRSRDVEKTTLP